MNTPHTWAESPIHEQIRDAGLDPVNRTTNDTPRTDHVVKKSDQKDAEMAFAIMTDHADCLERELITVTEQRDEAREALRDMLSGWRYIRQVHGDLYGVGWDRSQTKAEKALEETK
jgi:hypothetical protein